MNRQFVVRTLSLVAAFAAPLASAHTGHGVEGTSSGLVHLVDHLLALLAHPASLVGILLAISLLRGEKK
jgi:hydrogenase/urease accessory protein HupE